MSSTYVQNPPYFEGMKKEPEPIADVVDARILAIFGDKITTDHISPAGAIKLTSPAGKYLSEHQVRPADFNQYGTRRGNHEVMMRGTFANIRIKNFMLKGADGNIPEGGLTKHWPDGEQMSIYDAAMKYQQENVPLVVFAGCRIRQRFVARLGCQGHPSARRARRGLPELRAHPSLQPRRHGRAAADLRGRRIVAVDRAERRRDRDDSRLQGDLKPRQKLTAEIVSSNGSLQRVSLLCRIDTLDELEYYRNGGILQYVLRKLAA